MAEREAELLIDFYKNLDRQGPGAEAETLRALQLTGINLSAPLHIADIGCGTGGPTLTLAKHTKADITAVDIFPEFLGVLEDRAKKLGLERQITTLASPMDELPFPKASFDLIWSEGAIYIMGFEKGLRYLHSFLKEDGRIAISEVIWTEGQRPRVIEEFWEANYPEINDSTAKIAVLEQAGYDLIDYFVLPAVCWLDNYYGSIKANIPDFLERQEHSPDAEQFVESLFEEIKLYESFGAFYNYGFFIARKSA